MTISCGGATVQPGDVIVADDDGVTISCGGATVQPGDVIVADDDGAIVIPPALVHEVLEAAEAHEEEDAFVFEMVQKGESVDGLFPMNAEWREKYERWQAERRG